MSRYTLPFEHGGLLAYGFDHILGPFADILDEDDDEIESHSYFFDRSFDCHALAELLTTFIVDQAVPDILRTRQHIRKLWLDLPI